MSRWLNQLERLPLRRRFLVAPFLGLVLLGLLVSGFIYDLRSQNQMLTDIVDARMAGFNRYAATFARLSGEHVELYDLLTNSVALDEQAVYIRAKRHLDQINAAISEIEGGWPAATGRTDTAADGSGALPQEILKLSGQYRVTVGRAVETRLLEADNRLAQVALANQQFVEMTRAFTGYLEGQRRQLAGEIGYSVKQSNARSLIFAFAGAIGALLLFLLSLYLARILSSSLEAQIDTLAQIGNADRRSEDRGEEPASEAAGLVTVERRSKDRAGDELLRMGRVIESFQKTQTLLRESELRFRGLFEHNHAVMLLVDPASGAIIGANEAAAAFYGYSRVQLETMSIQQINTMSPAELAAARREVLQGRRSYFVFTHRLADGRQRNVEVHSTPIESGGATLLFSIIHDITERRQMEAALRQSQQLVQSILDHSGTVIFVKDLDGRYLLVNQRFAQLFDTPQESLVGKTDYDILPAPTADALRVADRETLASGRAAEFEEEIPQEDGLHTYISVKFPLYDEAGWPYATCGIATDITERKHTELALRASEAALNEAQAVARIGSWTYDIAGDALNWSAEACRIFGLDAEATQSFGSFLALVHAEDQDAVAVSWRAALGGLPYEISHRVVVDGDVRWVRNCAHIRFADDGRASFCIGTLQDITELKRAQEELFELNRDLERRVEKRTAQFAAASRAKSEFLSNMSHEIRTPMNTVLGMTHLVMRTALTLKQRDYLEKIFAAGEHLLGLIDSILDISKIEAGRLDLETVDFDLATAIEKLSNVCAPAAGAKGLSLIFEIDAEIPQRMRGDPLRLAQILINFTNNAVKFTEQGKVVVRGRLVELEPGSHCILRFEVEDTGIGMNAKEKAKVFRMFQQADSSMARKYGGTGLGLAICKQLAVLMGGEVGVDSRLGEGSTFWCTLRLALPESGATAARGGFASAGQIGAMATVKAALGGKRILVADDHPFNLQVVSELLEDVGVIVCVANNGKEAIDLLRSERFDCVLMDVQMPEMDGIETTRRVRAQPHSAATPVIAITANALDQDREICLAAGMDDFLSKPIQPEMLYATVARWVDRESTGGK
ncbi:MAG TPA: PAS domain S-box protein, partial [Rhodocyclaceae bacterium]